MSIPVNFRNWRKLLRIALYGFGIAFALFVGILGLFPPDPDAFLSRVQSIDRANDLGHAIFMYREKTGRTPDFGKDGWAFQLVGFVDVPNRKHIKKNGAMVDARGNTYEIYQEGDSIYIFSYAMLGSRRIDLVTGESSLGKMTIWQTIRLIIHTLFA